MEHYTGYYRVNYHYEGVPKVLQELTANEFMKNRNMAVEIFNEHIDEVNRQWDTLEKQMSFGDYLDDINPEYTRFINESIQPYIDRLNKTLPSFCKYKLGEYANIEGYLPSVPGSRIWITVSEVKEES